MQLTATEAYVLIQVLQGQTVHEAPVSNNVRALMAAISGAATYPGAISSETRTLVRAFKGDLTVNPTSENGRAIVAALSGKDSRNWPISTNVAKVCVAIFNQEDGDGDPVTPPLNTVVPAISGTLAEGELLTSSTGTWTGAVSYAYQWIRRDSGGLNPVNIGGATASTYTLVSADIGNTIQVKVTATNTGGSTQAVSAVSGVVLDSMTNVQKLALPANTAVGTVVYVSDWESAGLAGPVSTLAAPSSAQGSVTVIGGTQDGIYTISGTFGDKLSFNLLGYESSSFGIFWDQDGTNFGLSGSGFVITDGDGHKTYYSLSDVATPDLAGTDKFVVSIGSVAYSQRDTVGGKPRYVKIGTETGNADSIQWSSGASLWRIRDGSATVIDTSANNVATPDLATFLLGTVVTNTAWLNAADDTPASITVTSVTEGELYAGLRVTNDGSTNGSSYVSAPFHGRQYYMGLNGGGSNNMHWDTDFFVWTDDVGAWTSSNVAFPWQGADNGGGHTGATFARNDVANERNWVNS
jgi:hypothetical protein